MSYRILLVTDEPEVTESLSAVLRGIDGAHVERCAFGSDVETALEAGGVALLVVHLVPPQGRGLELLRAVRSHDRLGSVPVIMVATELDPDVADRCRVLGCNGYMVEPFEPEALRDLAASAVRRHV